MTRYPMPITNNTPPIAAAITPRNWDTVWEVELEEVEIKPPITTKEIPASSSSIPSIIVSIAIIVIPVGLCFACMVIVANLNE